MTTTATRPRIGFSTNIWDNPADIVGHLEFLAGYFTELEFEIAEEAQEVLFSAGPEEYERIVVGVRDVMQRHQLSLSVHAAWFGDHVDLCAEDPAERDGSIKLLKRAIDFAAEIGVDRVTYHPGYTGGRGNAELLDALCSSLDALAPVYTGHGITLCLENMGANRPRFVVFSPQEHVTLCERTGTGLTLDVPHLATVHLPRGDYDEALATVAPYVRTMHIADIKGNRHTHLPIGDGDFDLWGSLERLGHLGVDGPAIVEEFAKGYTPERYLEKAIGFRDRWVAAGDATAQVR